MALKVCLCQDPLRHMFTSLLILVGKELQIKNIGRRWLYHGYGGENYSIIHEQLLPGKWYSTCLLQGMADGCILQYSEVMAFKFFLWNGQSKPVISHGPSNDTGDDKCCVLHRDITWSSILRGDYTWNHKKIWAHIWAVITFFPFLLCRYF